MIQLSLELVQLFLEIVQLSLENFKLFNHLKIILERENTIVKAQELFSEL